MPTNIRVTAVLPTILSLACAFGQNYTISTFAGSSQQVNVLGTTAVLGSLSGVAVDSTGNVFFSSSNCVLRLDASTNMLTLLAGTGFAGFSGDNGPAVNAQLNNPSGVVVDAAGNVYIADFSNHRIRKVSHGVITTFAGTGMGAFNGDNIPATSADLYYPNGVALDASGNVYIADTYNSRIRKVSTGGMITTVAGSSEAGFFGDSGTATLARLDYPYGVAVDSSGNLYVADTGNNRIRKVSGGLISTIAGDGTFSCCGDNGPATSGQFENPNGVAVDTAGNVFVADTFNNRIRKISTNGVIATLSGNGTAGSSGDNGPAAAAELAYPAAVAVDASGNAYVADYGNSRIRKVSTGGNISSIAGNTNFGLGGDNGPATNAQFGQVAGVNVDSAGSVYITDLTSCRIRKVSGGVVTAVAGNGTCGFGGDNGPAIGALLNSPFGSNAVDSAGNLYIADSSNNRVRKVSNGIITTVAGTGKAGYTGDNGPATSAELYFPVGVAVDSAGNLYIADQQNNRVRKVSNGIITTAAGNGLVSSVGYPSGVAVDNAGNLYIAAGGLYEVSNGILTTIAANASLDAIGVAVDSLANIYVTDFVQQKVYKGSNGIFTAIAGSGSTGFGGDGGPATGALLSYPRGVAVDAVGNVYVADTNNNRIRILTPSTTAACTYALTPTSLQVSAAGGNFTVNIQTGSGCLWTLSGQPTTPSWISFLGATSGSGPASVALLVAPNSSPTPLFASITIAGNQFAVNQEGNSGALPSISAAGVTNGASFQTGIVPGGIITIFGTNLGAAPGWIDYGYWQSQVSGTSVAMNGMAAPTYLMLNENGEEQLSVQAPWRLAGASSASVSVTTVNGTSPAVMVPVLAAQPGIFLLDSASTGATHANGSLAGAANPASRGEAVVMYLTGLGAVSDPPATGASASVTNLSSTVLTPVVTIGGAGAVVAFSGLAPGFVGLYQLNVIVPATAASGLLDASVQVNGITSNTAKIAVQ